jgi:hypothetical protein
MSIPSIYGYDPEDDPFADFFAPPPKKHENERIPVRQRDSTPASRAEIEESPKQKDTLQPSLDLFGDEQS